MRHGILRQKSTLNNRAAFSVANRRKAMAYTSGAAALMSAEQPSSNFLKFSCTHTVVEQLCAAHVPTQGLPLLYSKEQVDIHSTIFRHLNTFEALKSPSSSSYNIHLMPVDAYRRAQWGAKTCLALNSADSFADIFSNSAWFDLRSLL